MLAAITALLLVGPLLAETPPPPEAIRIAPRDVTAAPPAKPPEPEKLVPVPQPAPKDSPVVEDEPADVGGVPVDDSHSKKHRWFHRKHKDSAPKGHVQEPEVIDGELPYAEENHAAKHSHWWHKSAAKEHHPANGHDPDDGIGPTWGGEEDNGPNAFSDGLCKTCKHYWPWFIPH
jgi:hypothetical protein